MSTGESPQSLERAVQRRNEPRVPRPTGVSKPIDRATLRRKVAALEVQFHPASPGDAKTAIQAELSYMRRRLLESRAAVNLTYPVSPPYAFVHISFDNDAGEFSYAVLEPTLRPGEQETLGRVREKMEAMMAQEELPFTDAVRIDESETLREYLRARFLSVLDLYDIDVSERRRAPLLYYLRRDFLGLGRTDAVLRDPFLEDVSCLGPRVPLYVFHRVFGSMRTNVVYEGELELNKYILRLAQLSGKHISIYQPILDATLHDGSRINLTLGTEVTRKGSTFSVRKFAYDPVSPIDLLRFGSVSASQLAYLWILVENHRSLLISGGTASGKTTLLNAVSMFIRPEDKIVSIEDTPEIHIDHQNWIQSVARAGYGTGSSGASGVSGASGISGSGPKPLGSVTLFDLLVAALRQRPEYVIVGEVRGAEAFTLFQAISVGHASMSTIHAGSISELLHRVENEPMNIPRVLFQALDAVAFPAQVAVRDSRVRRLTSVTEVLEIDPTTNELLTNDVYRWDPAVDRFGFLGRSLVFEKIAKASGHNVTEFEAEMRRKERFLALMSQLNITYYKNVSHEIASYYVNSERALRELETRVASG
ncbi:MAG: type II/IV secretion system ATPase subunit [Thermoplasmata archaeon]|nr:type II/IV secretion system ATPase subunit [Thermoplasmata archaeon]